MGIAALRPAPLPPLPVYSLFVLHNDKVEDALLLLLLLTGLLLLLLLLLLRRFSKREQRQIGCRRHLLFSLVQTMSSRLFFFRALAPLLGLCAPPQVREQGHHVLFKGRRVRESGERQRRKK